MLEAMAYEYEMKQEALRLLAEEVAKEMEEKEDAEELQQRAA